jgi:hypothetical protein
MDFGYGVKGDPNARALPTPAARQRAALLALTAAMAPEALDTPERLIPLLSSAQSGRDDRQSEIEEFGAAGGPIYDSLLVADVGAQAVLTPLSAPARLNRLVDQHRRDGEEPGVLEVARTLLGAAFAPAPGRLADIARTVQSRAVLELAAAARNPSTSPVAAAEIEAALAEVRAQLLSDPGKDPSERAHRARLARLLGDKDELKRLLEDPRARPATPPGMPIGEED